MRPLKVVADCARTLGGGDRMFRNPWLVIVVVFIVLVLLGVVTISTR